MLVDSFVYLYVFHVNIKMYRNLQLNTIKKVKKDYKGKLVKDIKIFLNKKNKKSDNMVVNVPKLVE